jgi:parallel beta-helix repeat protein
MKLTSQIMRTITIGVLALTLASCGGSSDDDSSAGDILVCFLTLFIYCRDAPVDTTDVARYSASVIQDRIDSAISGASIPVSPGTYLGTIDFHGKAVRLVSEQGPLFTTIDGNGSESPVVSFSNGEGPDSILDGFTIQNGHDKGIYAINAAPTIVNNIVTDTEICDGAGIELTNSSAVVRQNTIRDNVAICDGDRAAGAIRVRGGTGVVIVDNLIVNNSSNDLAAGITLWDAASTTIENNTIIGNQGGAIKLRHHSDALILQNIIANNVDEDCGGIDWQLTSNPAGARVINNTLVDNDGELASAICAGGLNRESQLVNNIIVSKPGQTAIFCGDIEGMNFKPAAIRSNDVYAESGIAYRGACANQTSSNGNISADPLFLDRLNGDYQLSLTSPAIDAGDSSVADLAATDISGYSRIEDGDLNTISQVDLGAFEFAY